MTAIRITRAARVPWGGRVIAYPMRWTGDVAPDLAGHLCDELKVAVRTEPEAPARVRRRFVPKRAEKMMDDAPENKAIAHMSENKAPDDVDEAPSDQGWDIEERAAEALPENK